MKLEFSTTPSKTMTREEAMKLKPHDFKQQVELAEVLCDGKIVLRTSKLDEVRQIFDRCLADLQKIEG